MKEYVLGFAFNMTGDKVVLINKLRPDWQKGFLNGVGGKIEKEDTSAQDAMSREFLEETGVLISPKKWEGFAELNWKNDIMEGSARVCCFRTFSNDVYGCKTVEDEKIELLDVSNISQLRVIKHLLFLIPMALDNTIIDTEINLK